MNAKPMTHRARLMRYAVIGAAFSLLLPLHAIAAGPSDSRVESAADGIGTGASEVGFSSEPAVPAAVESSLSTRAVDAVGVGLVPLVPARVLESREGFESVDGRFVGGGRVGPGVVEVDVLGRGGVPGSGVAAVMVNVTAVGALGRGFATVFPCGDVPVASSLNFSGVVPATANEVLAKVSDAGTVCVFASAAAHVLMDVTGYLAEPVSAVDAVGVGLVPLVPARVLESREGFESVDGRFVGGGRVGPGVVEVDVLGRGGVPGSGVAAVMVNVTAVGALGRGFATVFPCGDVPVASSLNFSGVVPATANEVLAKVSDAGTVCVFASAAAHVLMDVTGYLAEPDVQRVPTLVAEIETLHRSGWFAEPDAVTFTTDGQSAEFELVHYGDDGAPSGRAVPGGTELIRPTPTYDVSPLGAGRFGVSGSETIGNEVLGISVPGESDPIRVTLSSVRHAAGWINLADSDVQFPPAPGSDLVSLDPFTAEEIVARVPAESHTGRPYVPVILSGEQPVVGAKIINNRAVGTVIEPVGAPSIRRDGLTLVTLEIPEVAAPFDALDVLFDGPALDAAGLVPAESAFACLIDLSESDECTETDADGLAPVTRGRETSGVESDPQSAVGAGEGSVCKTSTSLAFSELKATLNWDIKNRSRFRAVSVDERLMEWEFFPGAGLTVTADIKTTINPTLELKYTCSKEFLDVDLQLPAPLTPFVSASFDFGAGLDIGAKIQGAFGMKAAGTCQVEVFLEGGAKGSRPTPLSPWAVVPDAGGGLTQSCDWTPADLVGADMTLGPSARGTLKPWLFAQLKAGVRIGGPAAKAADEAYKSFDVGDINIGEFKPIVVKVGPVIEGTLETPQWVLDAKKHEGGIVARLDGEAGLKVPAIEEAFKFLFGSSNISIKPPEPKIVVQSGEIDILSLALDGAPSFAVNGEAQPGPTVVIADDPGASGPQNVVVTLPDVIIETLLGEIGSVTADGLWVVDRATGEALDEVVVDVSGASPTLTIPVDDCDEYDPERVLDVVGGALPIPSGLWFGSFSITCVALFIDSGTVGQNGTSRLPVAVSDAASGDVIVTQQRRDGDAYALTITGDDGGLLSVSPASGIFDLTEVPATISVDCPPDLVNNLSGAAELSVTSDGQSDGPLTIHWLCPGSSGGSGGLVAVPDRVVLNSSFTLFNTSGDAIDWGAHQYINPYSLWSCAKAGHPFGCLDAPFGVLPSGGTLQPSSATSITLTHPTETVAACVAGGGDVIFFGDLLINSGVEKVEIGWTQTEFIATLDCDPDPPPCNSCGDPHITTFDGVRFDAQVLGEYVYGEGDDVRLVARHERSDPGGTGTIRPTSVTAVALEMGDDVIEAYTRASGGFELRVHGEVVDLDVGESFDVSEGLVLRRDPNDRGARIVMDGPLFDVYLRAYGGFDEIFDLSIGTQPNGSLRGLLGSNDDDPDNDLELRDGTSITVEQARAHDTELYSLTDSWRLTDPADSPFTVSSPVFDAPNEPLPGTEEMAPFRQQAIDLLGTLGSICSGEPSSGAYAVDVIALELAIGNVPDDLGQYLCNYVVVGDVGAQLSTGPLVPVPGTTIVIDAPGLSPCTTVVNSNGEYHCSLVVDIDEVGDGSGISFPLEYDLQATPPRAAAPTVNASGQFDLQAPFGGAQSITHDVFIDESDLTVVELGGTISEFGAPLEGEQTFRLTFLDEFDEQIGVGSFLVSADADGRYEAPFVVPADTATVEVLWRRGLTGDPRPAADLMGFTTGINERAFDASYNPPVVVVSGEARINGLVPGQVSVFGTATRPDSSTAVLTAVRVDVDPTTGAYSASVILPIGATAADITARVVGIDQTDRSVSVPLPILDGPNPVALSLVIDRPVLLLSGEVTENGVAFATPIDIEVVATTPGGTETFDVTASSDVAGRYASSIALPEGSTEAVLSIEVDGVDGAVAATTASSLSPGSVPVDLDVAVERPILALSGQIVENGLPRSGAARITVAALPSFSTSIDVVADASGTWDSTVKLPTGTTIAQVDVFVDGITVPIGTETVSALVAETRAVDVDADASRPLLAITGTIIEAGVARPGVFDLVVTSALGGTDTIEVTADVAGSFAVDVELQPTTTAATLEVFVDPIIDAVATSELTNLDPGTNPVVLDVVFDRVVSIDLAGTFIVGADGFGGPTVIEFRGFDGEGTAVTLIDDLAIDPEASGEWTASIELPPTARRLDLRWTVVDGSNFTQFVVAPGANDVDFDQTIAATSASVSGTLTEDGVAYTDATQLRVISRNAEGGVRSSTLEDVTPDGSGGYSFDIDLDPHVTELEVSWPTAAAAPSEAFVVLDGTNSFTYDANIDLGPRTVRLTGVASVDGAPWPGDVEFELTYRTSWGGFRERNTITVSADPVTGEYEVVDVIDSLSSSIAYAVVVAKFGPPGGFAPEVEIDPIAAQGTTSEEFDVAVEGRGLILSGIVSDGGAGVDDPVTLYFRTPDRTSAIVVDPDPGGTYDVEFVLPGVPTSVEVGVADGRFSNDVRWTSAPISTPSEVTELTGVDFDVQPPTLVVSGLLTEDSLAIDVPVAFDIGWTEPTESRSWNDQQVLTPGAGGAYSFEIDGPLSAQAGVVVVDVAAAASDRTATVDPLGIGDNAVPLTIDAGTGTLTVSGTALGQGVPFPDWAGPYPVTIEYFDGAAASLGTYERGISPDQADGSYTFDVPVPPGATSATLDAVFEACYAGCIPEFVTFTRDVTGLDPSAANTDTWNVESTGVSISAVVTTQDGTERTDGFDWTVTAYSGGTGGAELAQFDGRAGRSMFNVRLPSETDTVVFDPHLAGASPVLFSSILPGANERSIAITTDNFVDVTLSGIVMIDGEPATGTVEFAISGVRPGTSGRFEGVWFDYVNASVSAVDGSYSMPLVIAPEAVGLDVTINVYGATGDRQHHRYVDLSGTGPFAATIDIDQSAQRIILLGLAEIDGACATDGESFGFLLTVFGYAGDPADGSTPEPTVIFEHPVISSVFTTGDATHRWHWRANVAVPDGITHVRADMTTTGAFDTNGAELDRVGTPVVFPGADVRVQDDLVGACTP